MFSEADQIAKAHPCVKIYKRAWNDKTRTWATAKANYERDGLPIFLIGHSMGADAALAIARWLANDNIPVATVFSYDRRARNQAAFRRTSRPLSTGAACSFSISGAAVRSRAPATPKQRCRITYPNLDIKNLTRDQARRHPFLRLLAEGLGR